MSFLYLYFTELTKEFQDKHVVFLTSNKFLFFYSWLRIVIWFKWDINVNTVSGVELQHHLYCTGGTHMEWHRSQGARLRRVASHRWHRGWHRTGGNPTTTATYIINLYKWQQGKPPFPNIQEGITIIICTYTFYLASLIF